MMMRVGSQRLPLIISILIVLLIFSVSFNGCAGVSAAPHATVNKVIGEVLLQKSGTAGWVNATVGSSLQIGDKIMTGAKSSVVIVFFEGSVTELQENSEITIEEMRRKGGSTAVKLREEIGTTSSRVEKLIDPKSSFEVETPVGSAVVRGSVMGVIVLNDGTTIVDAIKGSCWAIAQGEEVLVPEGTRYIMYPGEKPKIATSSSASSTNPVINAGPSGQAPAFFNIEPYEEEKGESTIIQCQLAPEVQTAGWQEIYESVLMLRLQGYLQKLCPGTSVYVYFELGFAPGDYIYETGSQLMTHSSDFYYDIDVYDIVYQLYNPSLYEYPPVIHFRAKVSWDDSIGFGLEKEYEVQY